MSRDITPWWEQKGNTMPLKREAKSNNTKSYGGKTPPYKPGTKGTSKGLKKKGKK